MPLYDYRARDFYGRQVTGRIEAETARGAGEQLRGQGYFVVEIKLRGAQWGLKTLLQKHVLERKAGSKQLSLFCSQLATMLDAGLPLLTSLEVLQQQVQERKMRRAIQGIQERLEAGNSFADSLRSYPRSFPEVLVYMVEAGEVGGVLDEVLFHMAEHFQKEDEIYEKAKSALTYPAVVFVVAVAALLFLVTFVLPAFTAMLHAMDIPLPLPTRVVITSSELFQQYWYLVVGALAAAGYAARRYIRSEQGRYRWDRIRLKFPLFGELQRKIIISRFSRTLGTLLRGGVPILQALEVVKNATGNALIAEGVERAKDNIRDGGGMAGPLSQAGIFPPMVIQMVAVGEETGSLDELLQKVSEFYEREVDYITGRLSALIEPVIVAVLGLFVGLIIMSILLPLFSLVGGVA